MEILGESIKRGREIPGTTEFLLIVIIITNIKKIKQIEGSRLKS